MQHAGLLAGHTRSIHAARQVTNWFETPGFSSALDTFVNKSADVGFLDALRTLSVALDRLGRPGMIIGGVAVIAHGVPRLTIDIDATTLAAGESVEALIAKFAEHAIALRIPDGAAFARTHQVVLAVHEPSGTPIDVSLAWLPFEEEALEASIPCDYAGVTIRIPRPEDLVVYKLIAARPRDIDDAEGLLAIHAATMNLARVRRIVKELATAIDDEERPQVLERLIAKTMA
jgi:hypothetical protein